MSTITCNKDMTGNTQCKNSHLELPFGRLRGNIQTELFSLSRLMHY